MQEGLDKTLSRQLAEFINGFGLSEMADDDPELMKGFFLDWLGCAIAGSKEPAAIKVLGVMDARGGVPEADLIPGPKKTSCLNAALFNGVASHALEMDDLHREAILHSSAPTAPAVLAAAQMRRTSGKNMLAALAVAQEVYIRVALALGPSHYEFWHTTGTCGTFGAAAGAAKIMDLDPERTAHALGTAGTSAAGLWEFLDDGADSKQLHPGMAAMKGLLAALLAEKRLTGASRILEGEKGVFKAMSKDYDPGKISRGLGQTYFWRRSSFKFYASCGHTHSSIDALLKATGGRPTPPGEVRSIRVRIYKNALDLLAGVEPNTPYSAKFSLEYCLAAALVRGMVGLEEFNEEVLADKNIHEAMKIVHLESDDELTKSYPAKWPARVNIELSDGGILEGASDYPKGDPENPLSREDIIDKFIGLSTQVLTRESAEILLERVFSLEKLEDMNHLLDNLEKAA